MQFKPGEINIICTDVEASLRFYRDVLGFAPTTDEDGFYHLKFGGRQYLLLPTAKPGHPVAAYATVPQFSMDLVVDDLKAAYDYLKQQGVTFAQEWQANEPMFVIRDPDGLPWEVLEDLD
jgi:catechol 2,3-dioxygenase-like lactoylglutathione lyase family enzyme